MPLAAPAMDADAREAARAAVLRAHGAGPAETAELLAYDRGHFHPPPPAALPLDDEPCVAAWRGYAHEARTRGVIPVLRQHLVELRFPVAPGVSGTDAYAAATRRGVLPPDNGEGARVEDPDGVRLFIHPTPAGAVPVLVVPRRADFETLVRALVRRNEPSPIPPSMGACAVGGYVNWGRVAELRRRWQAGEVQAGGAPEWADAFAALRGRKELYQDRFILLSEGPYSGVSAARMGMEEDAWRAASLTIRLEHECAHYFTRRVLGSMRNHPLDELMADYAGIVAAAGRYRAEWFLRFCGVEDAEGCRADGRLWIYRGDPPLSPAAFAVLQRVVRAAALRVEAVDAQLEPAFRTPMGRARVLLALAERTLEELADQGAEARLLARLAETMEER